MSIQEIFYTILDITQSKWYSDIHLNTGYYPTVRNNSGEIVQITQFQNTQETIELSILSESDIHSIIDFMLTEEKKAEFREEYQVDSSYNYKKYDARYRVNCYRDTSGTSIAMRTIPQEIPSLESLWLGESIKSLCKKSKWLVLVTGPTGAWKSTNLAGMIDYINTNFKKHIITIEDPVEFAFKNKKSLINQREVWIHTKSFESAMKACLREDPDVIMVWEMRDPETIKAAITLAETGHLVFSTLHTNDTVQSIDRIVDVFPSSQQDQIRMQLAMSLAGVIAQRLLPKANADERIPVREVLLSNDAVRNLIITGKTHQLYSVIEVSQKEWMILMDNYLAALYKKWLITQETLLSYARDKENIDALLS